MTKKLKKSAALNLPAKSKSSKKPKSPRKPAAAAIQPASAPGKTKRIRGNFSMPSSDYALIAELKIISKKNGRPVKKNELLRAGLQALRAMSAEALGKALSAIKPAKLKKAA